MDYSIIPLRQGLQWKITTIKDYSIRTFVHLQIDVIVMTMMRTELYIIIIIIIITLICLSG